MLPLRWKKYSCKYFESSSILCHRIFGVFLIVDPRLLPPGTILKRWTPKVRDDVLNGDNQNEDVCESIASLLPLFFFCFTLGFRSVI
jgi:hypothetical protein